MSFFTFSTDARAASASSALPAMVFLFENQLNRSTPDCNWKPLDKYPVVIRSNVVGSWFRPELYPTLPLRFREGYCESRPCFRVSSAKRDWISACLTEILLASAYSTERLRSHLSCA